MYKKQLFPFEYICTETLDYPVLYHKSGDISVVFSIENTIQQYSCDPSLYLDFHHLLVNIQQLLGEQLTIHKQDIFYNATYTASKEDDILLQAFENHFEGRTYRDIKTYFIITRTHSGKAYSEFSTEELENTFLKIEKVFSLLRDQNFNPKVLDEEKIDILIKRYLAQNYTDPYFSLDNLYATKNHLRKKDEIIKTINLIDVENPHLPLALKPYNQLKNDPSYPTSLMHFLHTTPGVPNITFNQILNIPDQLDLIMLLETKKNRHISMNDTVNMTAAQDIDRVINSIHQTNDVLVYVHFNIILKGTPSEVKIATNYIDAQLSKIGITRSPHISNQLELFINSMPGHTHHLSKKYDSFLTTAQPASCLFYNESLPKSEYGNFKFRLTDRQGVPIAIDVLDLPMSTGKITNRNVFVLGPSGSGKSFVMNTYMHQLYVQNTDVVIIDTGHSYKGLCQYVGGDYITYTEENPITMNPFLFTKKEYNQEKRDFLTSLIALLWKGKDGVLSPLEHTALSEVIRSYYKEVFKPKSSISEPSFNSFYEFSIPELDTIRKSNNIIINVEEYSYVLKEFYRGGSYDKTLNKQSSNSLFEQQFIVFEIDNIKDNPVLFPIVTLIIMDVFLQKMRLKPGRKTLMIEEAWKAIASPIMATYIQYLYKTVRKWNGQAILVTQEVEDIIGNEILKKSVINNSDTIYLLDQSKLRSNYEEIAELLSLSAIEQSKIFTINKLQNKQNRSKFKEVYISLSGEGDIYGVEVSTMQYFLFSTESDEKHAREIYAKRHHSMRAGIIAMTEDFTASGLSPSHFSLSVIKDDLYNQTLAIYKEHLGQDQARARLDADLRASNINETNFYRKVINQRSIINV